MTADESGRARQSWTRSDWGPEVNPPATAPGAYGFPRPRMCAACGDRSPLRSWIGRASDPEAGELIVARSCVRSNVRLNGVNVVTSGYRSDQLWPQVGPSDQQMTDCQCFEQGESG